MWKLNQDNSQLNRGIRRGFTVIELLIVISIIAVLLSILLPGISKVRQMGMGLRCESNIKALTAGMLAFAAEHDGCLPGAMLTPNPAPYQADWLMAGFGNLVGAPQTGTLWPYINNTKTYLCPAMDTDYGQFGLVSNGHFDYGYFVIFNGAPLRTIPLQSQLNLLSGGTGTYPTPLICQEDAYQINYYDIEGDHSNVDQMSHIHNGGSYYGSVDGSVNWVIEPDNQNYWGNGCWQWSARGPATHAQHNLGYVNIPGGGTCSYWYWGNWVSQ